MRYLWLLLVLFGCDQHRYWAPAHLKYFGGQEVVVLGHNDFYSGCYAVVIDYITDRYPADSERATLQPTYGVMVRCSLTDPSVKMYFDENELRPEDPEPEDKP